MQVYLIRHAHAVDPDEDPMRPLSQRGEEQVRTLGAFLRRRPAVFQPEQIWHSSLLRSRQTAELLAGHLHLTAPRTLMPDIEPEDDPRAVARRIKATAHTVAIVGHEPHLSALATLLVVGQMQPATFVMKKCAALALGGIGEHWTVRWHLSPELLA